jgi:BirA family transcriptional regulator, biotin operon repressor / biotin---[acetyl-CoA-carboxylase] ligase
MSKLFKTAKVIKLKTVDSTNNYLSNVTLPLPEGSVVTVHHQTNGRGLGKNTWESEPGKNLTFSIILTPLFLKAAQQFYISKTIALALSDFISLYTDRVSIKWPNDIYAGDKKIAGILIENTIEGANLKQSIIGIGININQEKFHSSAANPVSLTQLTHEEYSLDELLKVIINLIEYRYILLKENNFDTIDENYMQALYRLNRKSLYSADEKTFEGTITGVDTSGELMITDTEGNVRKFWHKEVSFVL